MGFTITDDNLLRDLQREFGRPLSEHVRNVLKLVTEAHRGQFREPRFGAATVPFIVHPVGTAKNCIRYYGLVRDRVAEIETVICTALTHDLLEDTRTDAETLEEVAGKMVKQLVEALTKPSVSSHAERASRERLFLEKIVDGGPTAAYVKICDSMHNLSRPLDTPDAVIRRAVLRARTQYVSLIERCGLGEPLMKVYVQAIDTADKAIAEGVHRPGEAPTIETFEESLSRCLTLCSGKVLELHDILSLCRELVGATFGEIWHWRDNAGTVVESTGGEARIGRDVLLATSADKAQVWEGRQEISGFVVEQLITVPMEVASPTRYVIAIGYDGQKPPWVTPATVTILTTLLSHRLLLGEADRRLRIASSAAAVGAEVSVRQAIALGIEPNDLFELAEWRRYCRIAVAAVKQLLRYVMLTRQVELPMRSAIRVQGRVKKIASIVRKHTKQELPWSEFRKMEDIAGVRVVCPSISSLQVLEAAVAVHGARFGVRLTPELPAMRRDFIRQPTDAGYRGLHLILQVDVPVPGGANATVPCELQLRTILQDVWAVLSHETLYRNDEKRGARQRAAQKGMHALADKLAGCDQLLDGLITSRFEIQP